MPRPIVTGSISVKTWRMRGSCQSIVELQAEVDPPERAEGHRELDEGRDQDRDRVARRAASPFSTPPWKCGWSTTSSTMITTFQTAGEIAGIVKCS